MQMGDSIEYCTVVHCQEEECIRTLPRGGMYWEIHPKLLLGKGLKTNFQYKMLYSVLWLESVLKFGFFFFTRVLKSDLRA